MKPLPDDGKKVILLISDANVAIKKFPVVAWRMGKEWWTGIPGHYIRIKTTGPGAWTLDEWMPLSGQRPQAKAAGEG